MSVDRPVDDSQRQEALDPARSFIVQAPAGSGKTGLLTQRFLRLLAIVDEPEEIVAITFTRKAAAEMRARILQALQQARGDPEGPADEPGFQRLNRQLGRRALARSEARGWQLPDNPQRLRVRTIDSLCQYLVRQMPLSAGFGDAPGVDEQADELYAAAARQAVAEVESPGELGDALALLLGERDNRMDEVERLVAAMLARREQWLRHLFADNSREVIEQVMRSVVERHLAGLRAAFPASVEAELLPLLRYAAENLGSESALGGALAAFHDMDGLPEATVGQLAAWNALADLLLTLKGEWRKAVDVRSGFPAGAGVPAEAKQAMLALLEALRGEEGLAERLHGLRMLPEPAYSDAEWALLEALFTVLRGAVTRLLLLFAERGRVDFSEVSLAAQRALGREDEPSDLALRLDHQLRHLLVDEFQDTSRSQHDLLRLLTAGWEADDGRTLFLVGDPMQSIYRFRQAEVGLFLDAWEGRLGSLRLNPLRLSVNFRSRPAVIDWVNDVFPQVMPAQGDKERGAVPYAPSAAFGDAAAANVDAGVRLHPFGERDDAAEADRIIELIRDAQAEYPEGRTAVLVRGKAHLDALIPALRSAGLRYQAVEIGALRHRPQVMDLVSLSLALLHAADRVHWLALLRGPLCGLRLDDLHRLAGDGESLDRTVPALLADDSRRAALSDEGRVRCERLWSVLEPVLEQRERLPLREWVEGPWLALGGPLCLPDAGAAEDVEVYFRYLQVLQSGGRAVTRDRLLDGLEKLFSLPDPLADGRLQLMTIHKAKGLEFDTVILPGLGRKTRGDDKRLLYWLETTAEDGGAELFFGPVSSAASGQDPRTSTYIRNLEAEMGRLEDARLLYVATTRARRRLHLLGHAAPGRKDGVCAPDSGSLLACLWPAVAQHWAPLDRDPAAEIGEGGELPYRSSASPARVRVPGAWTCPAPPQTAGRAQEAAGAAEDAVVYEWAGEAARAVGTVVHRFLQRMAQTGAQTGAQPGAQRADPLPGFERLARRLLRSEGLPGRELDGAVERVRAALQRTLDDPRGRWVLSSDHAEAANELPLTALVEGRVRRLVVDRTFVDAEGTRWIIDYKTGTHEGGDVEGFLDREQDRYRAQLAAYAAAFRALEDRPLRTALYYPLVEGGWREWGG